MRVISLSQMDSIRLMNRTDTKFFATPAQLDALLEGAGAAGYYVFDDGYGRITPYDTLYYDTPGLDMYLAHHNRRLVRRKVRVRTYVHSGVTFLEVKLKDNHGRTRKKRRECTGEEPFEGQRAVFVAEKTGYGISSLNPSLRTVFDRITLVNPEKTERLTIDFNLRFLNPRTGVEADMGDGVIVELKQDSLKPSKTREILRELRVKPFKISKYCIGTALTTPGLKQNRFKTKIRTINKLTRDAAPISPSGL